MWCCHMLSSRASGAGGVSKFWQRGELLLSKAKDVQHLACQFAAHESPRSEAGLAAGDVLSADPRPWLQDLASLFAAHETPRSEAGPSCSSSSSESD